MVGFPYLMHSQRSTSFVKIAERGRNRFAKNAGLQLRNVHDRCDISLNEFSERRSTQG